MYLDRTYLKNGFWFKIKAAVNIKPEEHIEYFEDLVFAPNAEFGPKAVFKIGSMRSMRA